MRAPLLILHSAVAICYKALLLAISCCVLCVASALELDVGLPCLIYTRLVLGGRSPLERARLR
jgi:hypothetical protein